MSETDYAKLQERYGGLYVARRGEDVRISGRTFDELVEKMDEIRTELGELVIEYIEPIESIAIY